MKTFLVKLTIFSLFFLSGINVLVALSYPIVYQKAYIRPAIILGTLAFFIMGFPIYKKNNIIEFLGFLFFISYAILVFIKGGNLYTVNYYSVCLFPLFYSVIIKIYWQNKNIKRFTLISSLSFYILNCIIAIIERINYHNFLPDVGAEQLIEFYNTDNFRSVGLMGMPLEGSFFTSMLTLFIIFSNIKSQYKTALVLLGITAQFSYNSRAALIVTGVGFVMYFLKDFFVNGSAKKRLILLLSLVVIIILIIYLFQHGFGSRLISFGTDDSSQVRLDNMFLLSSLSYDQLLFGAGDNATVVRLTNLFGGYSSIIENPWLNYIIRYGLVFLIIMLVIYFFVFKNLFKQYSKYDACVLLGAWIGINTSYISFSSSCDYHFILLITLIYLFVPTRSRGHAMN